MRHHALLPCLLASGATGLAYELLWTRLLSLSFGSTTLSFSTVLAVFFGGMALGSWLAGRFAHKLKSPARVYGLIEAALGALGLITYPAMLSLDRVLAWFSPETSLSIGFVRVLISGLLLAAPTVLMGATLPVVSRAVIRSDDSIGSGTALIYGLNTLGAFLGTYVVTFHLLPGLGIFKTMLLTVATNAAVAACAIAIDRRSAVLDEDERTSDPGSAETDVEMARATQLAALLTFLNGFALISLEVVWTRTFASLLQGTVYALGAVLMAVLAGIGAGSFALSRATRVMQHPAVIYVVLQTFTLISVAVVFWYFTPLAYLLESLSAFKGPASQHYQLLAVIACLIVPTFCSGASLPLLVQLVESRAARSSEALGTLLAANTVGAIAGSLLTGFVLIPGLGSPGSVTLAIALLAMSALLGAALLCHGRGRVVALAVAASSVIVLVNFDGYDNQIVGSTRHGSESFAAYVARQERERGRRVFFAEGRDGTIGVTLVGDTLGLQLNGLGQGGRSLEPPHYIFESAVLAALALIHGDEPATAMVVGLGSGVTVDALSKSGVGEVTALEIEERVARAVEAIWLGDSPVDRPGVRLVVEDARHHLVVNSQGGGKRYDVIASMPSHPWVAPNIFTREFFELVAESLSERGVFVSWFGYNGLDGPTVKSLFRAFTAAFPHYFIYQFDDAAAYYLVGSRNALRFDVRAVERLASSPVFDRPDQIGDAVYLASHVHARGAGDDVSVPPGPVNTDDSAFVETRAPRPTSEPPVFDGFFEAELLDPTAAVSGVEPRPFLIDLLESLLGTPAGRLPVGPVASHPTRAARTLAAGETLLSQQERAYYAGRADALVASTRARGLESLARAAAGVDAQLAERARLFAALANPRFSSERREALLALRPSRDAALAVLDEQPGEWRRFAPRQTIAADEDAVGWLLSPQSVARAGPERARGLVAEQLVPVLMKAQQPYVVALAAELASERGWRPEAGLLRGRAVDLGRKRAAELRTAAISSANDADHAHSLALLREAIGLAPADIPSLETLVEVATRAADEAALQEAARHYVALGRSSGYVNALADRARASGLGHLRTLDEEGGG